MLAVFVVFRFGLEVGNNGVELANELMAGMSAKDLVEPSRVGLGVFGRQDFHDVTLPELGFEINHFSINLGARACGADFAVEAIGKVERH